MEHGLTLLSDGSAATAVTPVCLPTWDSETASAEATKDTALLKIVHVPIDRSWLPRKRALPAT